MENVCHIVKNVLMNICILQLRKQLDEEIECNGQLQTRVRYYVYTLLIVLIKS